MTSLVEKFRAWRDRLENALDSRLKKHHLEQFSHYLVEFENQRFDDIEIPSQYFKPVENAKDLIRIDRFEPEIEAVRMHGGYQKRIAIRGHDGSLHSFIIQHPALRTARREERIMQMFQVFNG